MFTCLACESMYPDMCNDCMETIQMDCLEDAAQDEKEYNEKINIASGEDYVWDAYV